MSHPRAPKAGESAKRQLWATPPELVAGVELLSEIPIVLDVCAEAWSAKAPAWFGPGSTLAPDALAMEASWASVARWSQSEVPRPISASWCNPPFNAIDGWADRALEEASDDYLTWLCVPFRSERPWVASLLLKGAHLTALHATKGDVIYDGRTVLKSRRIAFEPPPGVKPSTPMGSVVLFQVGGGAPRLPQTLSAKRLLEAGRRELLRRAAA